MKTEAFAPYNKKTEMSSIFAIFFSYFLNHLCLFNHNHKNQPQVYDTNMRWSLAELPERNSR